MIVKIYKKYRYSIYPRVKHLRGTTRLLKTLEKLSLKGVEEADISQAESMFDRDWDNLIVLDGCRYDTYKELRPETEKRVSMGSCSADSIKNTFSEGDFSDTILITANPHFHSSKFEELTGRNIEETFFMTYHTYQTDWNEEENTVIPESVVRDALSAENLYPDKKKIIWFMQPHHPFIGFEEGKGFQQDIDIDVTHDSIWGLAERNKVSKEKVLEGYRNNLEYVLEETDKLTKDLSGKTVITSDHGNLIGENNRYGHPCKSKAKPLRKVPWEEI